MSIKDVLKIINKNKDQPVRKIIKEVCGPMIGRGVYRDVYAFKDDDKYVFKVERKVTGMFCNVTEYRNYANNQYWRQLGPWLAPCYTIAESGLWLIQEKVTFWDKSWYPKKIPNLFIDRKYANYGWIGDRFVACDYPYLRTVDFKLVRAAWHGWPPGSEHFG